jgi:hypothetical protein
VILCRLLAIVGVLVGIGRLVTPSTVNRELAILRHLLRLAEEWGYIAKVPKIRPRA